MAAEARTARRGTDDGPGLEEDGQQPFLEGLGINPVGARDDDEPDARGRPSPSRIRAAIRRSPIRPFVHEPMTT